MEKLFGIPIDNLLYGSLGVFFLVLLVLAVAAFRNRVLFKMGVRNIIRRPAQTILIVLGLMLATLLISAALVTGDTMSYSIKKTAIDDLGKIDIIVKIKGDAAQDLGYISGGKAQAADSYFSKDIYDSINNALSGEGLVEAAVPVIIENVPAVSPKKQQNLPSISVLGVTYDYTVKISPLIDKHEKELQLSGLKKDEAYLSLEAAGKLDVNTGDEVQLFLGSSPKSIKVAGIYQTGGNPSSGPSMVMHASSFQKIYGKEGKFNAVLISNKGDDLTGADHTDEVVGKLKPVLDGGDFAAHTVKKDALTEAEEAASAFTSMFLIFGEFSMLAGVMLIFLIFVMLAAERKTELGVLRALGTRRRGILKIFVFEGAVYALLAAAVGSVFGVAVGWGMVKVMAVAFGSMDVFNLHYHFNAKSLAIAYTMGVITTFIVVFFSAWRAGRINIVRAIRDIPEPNKKGRSVKSLIFAVVVVIIGVILIPVGIQGKQAALFNMGASFVIIGLPLLARYLKFPERAAFTAAGLGLLLWWLKPDGIVEKLIPSTSELSAGIEMFIISGVAIVMGAVWAVMYNSDILLSVITAIFSRIKGAPPILKIAINYPMRNRFRTGMALAMFSLIIFTIVFMGVLTNAFVSVYDDIDRLSGGFHIQGSASHINPIADISKTLDAKGKGIDSGDFEAIGGLSMMGAEVRQKGVRGKEWRPFMVQGADAGYLENIKYSFKLKGDGYKTDADVWRALRDEPGLAVVYSGLVPTKANMNMGNKAPSFMLSGFYLEDEKLPDVYIEVKDPVTGKVSELKVIGVIEQMAFYAFNGVYTSQETVSGMTPAPVPPTLFWFKTKPGVDVKTAARNLGKTFYENGMSTMVLEDNINKTMQSSQMMNDLLQGFMALGLVVGIAALGVIAARAVVERRQQIGMLRAIGFRRGMVQSAFILESSFVAVLGIIIGSALGLGLSYNVVLFMAKEVPGLTYELSWQNVLFIAALAYAASLLTTYLPARQAAKVYPAEALRYE